jgi:ABC-type amino acid transport substrate-binding protein
MFKLIFVLAFATIVFADKPLKIGSILNAPFLIATVGKKTAYEGFVVDFSNALTEKLGSKYKIRIASDDAYGHYDEEEKTWTGLIGDVVNGKVDMAIADLTITEERKQHVDFSKPFLNTGVGLVASAKEGALPYHTLVEMVNNPETHYGVVRSGSTMGHITKLAATCPIFKKMVDYWEENTDNLVGTLEEGLTRVDDEPGKYGLLMEMFSIDGFKEDYPDLIQVGPMIIPREFAVVVKKGSTDIERINHAIDELDTDGTLSDLLKKWKIHGEKVTTVGPECPEA